jgi:lipopolysaccharide export system protein LptA
MTRQVKSNINWHRGQLICLLCLFPLFLSVQSAHSKVPFSKKEKASAKSIQTNSGKTALAKVQESSKKPSTKKTSGTQLPMTQKYIQSGLMKVPQMNVPAKKRNKGQQITLEHSEVLSYDAFVNPDYQIFSGNVRFRHEGARLFCDSAHYYQKSNSLYAFGNVHMEQGDTLFLYGAWLFYDGNTKLVQVREKVRLENRSVTLFTDSLNYDRITNVGYFFDGGLLVDATNELSSEYGQYNSRTKIADFRNDVKLVHPKFVMTNNELIYNTQNHIADINVPTEIVADSGYVNTSKGWYNTQNETSSLFNRSYVISDHRRLTGDTVNYDQKNGIGEAYGNVVIVDTTQQMTMKGGYGYSEEKTGFALMTRHAVMIEHSGKDTLYLHADTLISHKDSIYKAVTAYHGVRFFRTDFQGVCDSLYYSTRDSILSFYNKPILWSAQQQLTGDFMQMHTKGNKPQMLHIQKAAMVISQETDSLYNQSSGKDLKAYFDSSQVVKVEIRGNAETVYLPRDKDSLIIGLNRLEGSSLDLFRENEKVKKVVVWPEPKGKFYPLDKLDPTARYLKNFAWYVDARPANPDDIFRKYKVKEKEKEKSRTSVKITKPDKSKKESVETRPEKGLEKGALRK